MAREPTNVAGEGTVLATALVTVHYVSASEVIVAAPGDLVEVPATEAAGLVERGAIRLAEPAPEPPAA